MTVIFPEATGVQGQKKVAVVQALAASPAVSLASDINAASTVDASFFFYQFNPSSSQNKGNQPARIGERAQLDKLGNTTYSAPQLVYVYDPQADDTTDENAVKAALPDGAEVFLIERMGGDAKTAALAVGDQVRVHHVKVGYQSRTESGTDEYAVYQITQECEYVEDPFDATVAA